MTATATYSINASRKKKVELLKNLFAGEISVKTLADGLKPVKSIVIQLQAGRIHCDGIEQSKEQVQQFISDQQREFNLSIVQLKLDDTLPEIDFTPDRDFDVTLNIK